MRHESVKIACDGKMKQLSMRLVCIFELDFDCKVRCRKVNRVAWLTIAM